MAYSVASSFFFFYHHWWGKYIHEQLVGGNETRGGRGKKRTPFSMIRSLHRLPVEKMRSGKIMLLLLTVVMNFSKKQCALHELCAFCPRGTCGRMVIMWEERPSAPRMLHVGKVGRRY
jgi:hypothetical protein